ncbi:MAG: thiamine-phosphate synthase family protein [Candidatus Helarchaeota archaeon]
MEVTNEIDMVLGNLCRALRILEDNENISEFIPEVRINFVYALEKATTPAHVAAIPGRITAIKNRLIIPSYPQFGSSDHMARAIIEIMKYDTNKRAGINFLYTDKLRDWLENYCKKESLTIGLIDRAEEPKEVSEIEGHSMPWKIKSLFENSGNIIPDIFYENEALGKEPLFVLVGNSAVEVAEKFSSLVHEYFKSKEGEKDE